MSASPETPQPTREQNIGREYLDQASAFAAIAYNGLRARISQVRLGMAESHTEEAMQNEAFYSGLQNIAEGVVIDESADHPNRPMAPVKKHFLDAQGESNRKILDQRAVAQGPSPPRGPRRQHNSPGVLGRPEVEAPARTRKQRREEMKLAQKVHFIRSGRTTQAKRAKVFGEAGPVSALGTFVRKEGLSFADKHSYKRAGISAFELLERKQALPIESVVIRDPKVVRKTGRKLERTGEKTVEYLSKATRGAQRQSARAEKRVGRREQALTKRNTKLGEAHQKRAQVRQHGEDIRQRLYDHLNQVERERLAKLPNPSDPS